MATITHTTETHKPAIAYYGWLHEEHGIFLQSDGVVRFCDDATARWQEVDLETLTTWAVLNGRCDLADAQLLLDGDRVKKCSKTLQRVAA